MGRCETSSLESLIDGLSEYYRGRLHRQVGPRLPLYTRSSKDCRGLRIDQSRSSWQDEVAGIAGVRIGEVHAHLSQWLVRYVDGDGLVDNVAH